METRDIVNALEVKKTIVERSQRRKDDPEITQWFEKKFFEYVIKQFNPVFLCKFGLCLENLSTSTAYSYMVFEKA